MKISLENVFNVLDAPLSEKVRLYKKAILSHANISEDSIDVIIENDKIKGCRVTQALEHLRCTLTVDI